MSWKGPAWSLAIESYLSLVFALALPLASHLRRMVFLALGFFGGCLFYDLRSRAKQGLSAPGILDVASLAVMIGLGLAISPGPSQYLFPMACGLLVFVFSFERGPISRVLRNVALQKLGLWSYSVYMVRTLVFQLLKTGASFLEKRSGLDRVGRY